MFNMQLSFQIGKEASAIWNALYKAYSTIYRHVR